MGSSAIAVISASHLKDKTSYQCLMGTQQPPRHFTSLIRGLSKKYPTLGREKKVMYLGGYNT